MNGLTQRFTCFLFVLEVMAFVMSMDGERRMEKENKVLFALMLAVFAIVACALITFDDEDVSATDGVWSSGSVTSLLGEGTETNPYKIGTANELAFLAKKINTGEAKYVGKHYVLVSDINLAGKEWVPIGTKDKPFAGVFDGKDHKIAGLTIKYVLRSGVEAEKTYMGLFGATSSDAAIGSVLNGYEPNVLKILDWSKNCAVLKNIVFTDVGISVEGQAVGALVGKATNTYIDNVKVKSGSLLTMGNSGGVVGFLSGSVVINVSTEKEYTVGTVAKGGYSIGGIVGAVRDNGNSAIINSTNNAKVEVYITSASAAGILGNIADKPASTLVYGCVNNGPVSIKANSHTDGDYLNNSATGIVGHSNGQLTTSIINCTNYGKISNDGSIKAGSLAGISKYTAGLISGCVNYGEIVGDAEIRSGIISHNYMNLVIRNCDNKGTVVTGDAIVADIIALNQGGITVTDMVVKSPEEIEKYIPVDFKFSFTIDKVTCPKGKTINFNPTTIGTNVTINIIDSLNGSTFKINKGDGINVCVEGTDVSVLFGGEIGGTTSVHCDNIKVTLSRESKLTRFYLYGNGNEVKFYGKVIESIAIGSDTRRCSNNTIIFKEEFKTANLGVYVCGNNNAINNAGTIDANEYYGVKVIGDNNTLVNETGGVVKNFLLTRGTDNTIRNFGQIYTIDFIGTGIIVNEHGAKIEGEYSSNGGHKISVGTSAGASYVSTKVTIYNYGTVKGLDALGSFYILYTAGFDNITWYNHKGSEIIETNNLFCFQQKGYPTTGETMRGSCNMNFYFVDGTIKKDGSNVTINDNSFSVVSQGTKADYGSIGNEDGNKVGLIKLNYGEGVDVATENKFVPVFRDKTFILPTLSLGENNLSAWMNGGEIYKTTSIKKLSELPTSELTAVWTEKPIKVTTACFPSDGGSVTKTHSYNLTERVVLEAIAEDGYRFLRWSDGTTDATKTFLATTDVTYTAEFVKLVTVTFENNGTKTMEVIDEGSKIAKPVDPSRLGFVFSGWYDGTSMWDFDTAITEDITLNANWVEDSSMVVITHKDGKVDFNIPTSTAATNIVIKLPNNVAVTLGKDVIASASDSNITASVTKLTSDMFEITVNKDGTTMNAIMSITLPYTSGKGTPSVYYYPASGDKVLMGGTIDATTSTITFQTNHNSVYGIVYATPTPDVPVPPITPGDDNNIIVNVTKEGTNQNVTFMAAIATMVASLLLLAVVIKRK